MQSKTTRGEKKQRKRMSPSNQKEKKQTTTKRKCVLHDSAGSKCIGEDRRKKEERLSLELCSQYSALSLSATLEKRGVAVESAQAEKGEKRNVTL